METKLFNQEAQAASSLAEAILTSYFFLPNQRSNWTWICTQEPNQTKLNPIQRRAISSNPNSISLCIELYVDCERSDISKIRVTRKTLCHFLDFLLRGKARTLLEHGHGFCPVASATGRVGYATRVQDWTRVVYPMRPVALATGQKPCPTE